MQIARVSGCCRYAVSLWVAGSALAAAAAAARAAATPPSPPRLLLHLPFDGSPDAEFAANGQLKTSYLHAAYRPGVRAQGAEFGSERFPAGLLVRCKGMLDKARGSLEFWYMPLWNPADPTQQGIPRVLFTDEKPPGAMGHFWALLSRGVLLFGLQGQKAASVSAPIHRWRPETWHHVAVTWDGETGIRLFLDGEMAAEQALRWRLPPSELLYLGSDRFGGCRAGGLFDELRLYDRALTATEVELAFIHNLAAERAPAVLEPAPPALRPPHPARLTFQATFDNIVEAQTAAGNARPLVAEGVRFAPGLFGQALAAAGGLNLAYDFTKNLSRDEGAISFWACAMPDKRPWRAVLVSDELFGGDPQRDSPGALALWLERDAANLGIFTLWPLRSQLPLVRWDERDWHHFAACWRRGEQATFYINGIEAGRATESQAVWAADPAERLYVGSVAGNAPGCALIDDLRFYDGPLTRDEVQKQASQLVLPFVLELSRSLYMRGQAADLVARFYNTTSSEAKAKVLVRVLAPGGKAVHSVEAPLEVPARGWSRLRMPLTADALSAEGLYEVVTSCEGRVTCPRCQFLVVAPPAGGSAPRGPDAAPKFEYVTAVECAKQASPDLFCETGGSRVARSEAGAYREAGGYPDARFAYRFRVTRTDVPHVAVVTYPADRARSAEIIMTSRRYPASRDVATGYFVQRAASAAPRMVELPLYFWPRELENSIMFRTLVSGEPAACAKITVRQIVGGLPPAPIEAPSEGGRTLGVHWEDPSVPVQFGATGLRPPEVYESFRRLLEYLKFTGQNLLCYPVMWHRGLLYPAEAESFRLGIGAERHCAGWLEQVLHLCEQAGVQFVPEVIFDDAVALSSVFSAHTIDAVAGGTTSARMVSWDDTLTRGDAGDPPRYNPLHPAVRAALLDRMTEIAERYSASPALAGVSLVLGPEQSTWFGSIQCGYDDQTVADFAREAKFELPPECRTGPTRFSERARWLIANKYDLWISYRCRRLRQLYVDLASRVQSKRPDLKLYLTVGLPDGASPHPLMNLTALADRIASLDTLYREAGLDVSLYKDRPTNLVLRRVVYPTDDRYLVYRFAAGGPSPATALARDLAFSSESSAPYAGFGRLALAVAYRPFESTIGALQPLRAHWWPEHPARASAPTPSGREFLEPCAQGLANLDALSLTLGSTSLATAGHEETLREFARAYRALPAEPFATVAGMADPVCVRELQRADGRFFYLVNRASFPVDAYVALSGAEVRLRDLAAAADLTLPLVQKRALPAALPPDFVSEHALADDEGPLPKDPEATQEVTGALLQVRLEPFQLRSYRIETSGAAITYAAARAPAAERLRLAQRIASARDLIAHSNAPVEAVAAARLTLDLVERAWRKHELARVAALLDSYPLERLR